MKSRSLLIGLLLPPLLATVLFAQTIRVACVGDSITAGGYPEILDSLLPANYDVRNFGVSGATALGAGHGNLPYRLQPGFAAAIDFAPNIVVIKLGTNDSKAENWANRQYFATDLADLVADFSGLSSHPQVFLCTPVAAMGTSHDIAPRVIETEIVPQVQQLAGSLAGVRGIDCFTPFLGHADYYDDGIHPNEAGRQLLAATIHAALTTPADTTPPGTPAAPSATATSTTAVQLTWTAASGAPSGYFVYRDGLLVATVRAASFAESGLVPGTFSYTVRAFDAALNLSAASPATSINTLGLADTTPPSAPTGLAGSATSSTAIRLTWTASTDPSSGSAPASGVAGYTIYRNGTRIGTSETTSYWDTGLSASMPYAYRIAAYDAAGNVSPQCTAVNVTTLATARPVISAVSGTVADNQTITITGANFGAKSPAAPILWADFSSGINPSSLGQRTAWSDIQNLVRTASLPPGAGTSNGAVGTWDTSTGDPHYVPSFSFGITKTYWTQVYVYAKRYFDFDATTNQKFFRINPNPVINRNDYVAVYHKGWWTAFLNEGDDDNPDRLCETAAGMNCYTRNQWMSEEFIWQYAGGSGLNANGSPGAGSGIIDYTRDGVVFKHMENINNGANTQSDLRMLDNFTPNNIPTDTPPNGSHVYMTDMYADDTYSRVMLGNAPTMAASTHREILIPSAWSATSISAVVNQGTFAAGSTAYLYVFDSSNTPNTSGYPVTIAAGSDDITAPTVPTGLTGAATSATAIRLSWTASTDNVGVAGYRVHRNGTQVGTSTTTTCTDTGLSTGTTYSYTVTAVDAAGNVSPASAAVSVVAHDETYTTFATWVAGNFTAAEQANTAISGPNADPDGCGLTNLARYAFGLPARGLVASPVALAISGTGTNQRLTLTFPRKGYAPGLQYTVQSSTDLVTWTDLQTVPPGYPKTFTFSDSTVIGSSPRRFLRLRVAAP